MTVRTCSPDTTTNSFIVTAAECTTEGEDAATTSTPKTLTKLAKSSETNCDIHGTYITFELKENESRYIFVGPESFNTDCFIHVEFYMDFDENDIPKDESDDKKPVVDHSSEEPAPADSNTLGALEISLIVIAVILIVVIVLAVVLVVIFLIRKKQKSTYSTLA